MFKPVTVSKNPNLHLVGREVELLALTTEKVKLVEKAFPLSGRTVVVITVALGFLVVKF